MQKRAVTLIELIVAVVIIAIIAAISLPQFTKTMETGRAKEARVALRQLRTGERIYRTEYDTYFPTDAPISDIAGINTALRTSLDSRAKRAWNYSITAPTADTFVATAIRRSGHNINETISIDQDGNIDETGWTP